MQPDIDSTMFRKLKKSVQTLSKNISLRLPHLSVPAVTAKSAAKSPSWIKRLLVYRKWGKREQSETQFINASYTSPLGTLKYRLFIPSSYQGQPMPLIVMLHGCKQDAEVFAAGTRMNALAEKNGCLILYPSQTYFANPKKCWNWHKTVNQRRDMGEPALIAGLTQKIMKTYEVDSKKVFIGGMSAGAAMAYIVGTAYAELYAAIGMHSGLLYRGVHNIFAAMSVMKLGSKLAGQHMMLHDAQPGKSPPVIVFHGDQDRVVRVENAHEIISYHCHGRELQERADKLSSVDYQADRTIYQDPEGEVRAELWIIHGEGHAWSGGSPEGNYVNPNGPDASAEMLRFFMART